jgi:hypothetical protein
MWSNHLFQQTKQKKTESKSKDAPRKMHRIWSNKNIVSWKVTWFCPMKNGCLGGIPKLWRLYILDISWGDMGIPKLELFSILHLISSISFSYTWKLPSYKTSHNSISKISVNMIINLLFWFSFKLKYTIHWSISYCSNFLKSSVIKRTQKESDWEVNTNSGRICQNRTADKDQFFWGPSVAQIEKWKSN